MKKAAVSGLLASYDESLCPEFGDSNVPKISAHLSGGIERTSQTAGVASTFNPMQTCVAVPNSFTEITSLVGTPDRWVGHRALPALAAVSSAQSAAEVPFAQPVAAAGPSAQVVVAGSFAQQMAVVANRAGTAASGVRTFHFTGSSFRAGNEGATVDYNVISDRGKKSPGNFKVRK
ncbi:MAG TPA: hypothetical protein VKD19_01820 [Pseudolabrys sp.]|nr:hypothetical protein [Pseudolabrys sp.]